MLMKKNKVLINIKDNEEDRKAVVDSFFEYGGEEEEGEKKKEKIVIGDDEKEKDSDGERKERHGEEKKLPTPDSLNLKISQPKLLVSYHLKTKRKLLKKCKAS
ncbi:hypothetical protein LSTR_LSTR013736 [Laodelphax striatellus]|uniref:Uncharacterized protein n=1 Tax=Laodelphax striatellus TaxID=195883 RepID=A0A482WLZ1_LAOST|nr:hypothetical protein LSTR_LSTR013736 [Laodelphax striatellus]